MGKPWHAREEAPTGSVTGFKGHFDILPLAGGNVRGQCWVWHLVSGVLDGWGSRGGTTGRHTRGVHSHIQAMVLRGRPCLRTLRVHTCQCTLEAHRASRWKGPSVARCKHGEFSRPGPAAVCRALVAVAVPSSITRHMSLTQTTRLCKRGTTQPHPSLPATTGHPLRAVPSSRPHTPVVRCALGGGGSLLGSACAIRAAGSRVHCRASPSPHQPAHTASPLPLYSQPPPHSWPKLTCKTSGGVKPV
jgi:hypothetical protein